MRFHEFRNRLACQNCAYCILLDYRIRNWISMDLVGFVLYCSRGRIHDNPINKHTELPVSLHSVSLSISLLYALTEFVLIIAAPASHRSASAFLAARTSADLGTHVAGTMIHSINSDKLVVILDMGLNEGHGIRSRASRIAAVLRESSPT